MGAECIKIKNTKRNEFCCKFLKTLKSLESILYKKIHSGRLNMRTLSTWSAKTLERKWTLWNATWNNFIHLFQRLFDVASYQVQMLALLDDSGVL
jgi:hypothetical protein